MPAQAFSDPDAVRLEAEAWGRALVAGGGKLVGVVTASAPFELIAAAGMAAMELSAGDVTQTPRADEMMETLFHPPIRGLLERTLRGDFAHLSAIVLPRTGDAPHRLYYYLCELERTGVTVPRPLLFDVTQTPGAASEAYTAQALVHLWHQLRAVAGSSAGDVELRSTIVAFNRRRALLGQLADRRRKAPLPGAQALAAFMASRMLPDDTFEQGLTALLSAPATPAGPRIVIAGSSHDDSGLHRLIEAAGGCVVGDAHGAGEPSIGDPIDTTRTPMEALATHYRATRAGARAFRDAGADILAFANAARADGVIFSYFAEEEALTWDYPEQAVALAGAGIAAIRLGPQTRPFDWAGQAEIKTFIGSLGAAR